MNGGRTVARTRSRHVTSSVAGCLVSTLSTRFRWLRICRRRACTTRQRRQKRRRPSRHGSPHRAGRTLVVARRRVLSGLVARTLKRRRVFVPTWTVTHAWPEIKTVPPARRRHSARLYGSESQTFWAPCVLQRIVLFMLLLRTLTGHIAWKQRPCVDTVLISVALKVKHLRRHAYCRENFVSHALVYI